VGCAVSVGMDPCTVQYSSDLQGLTQASPRAKAVGVGTRWNAPNMGEESSRRDQIVTMGAFYDVFWFFLPLGVMDLVTYEVPVHNLTRAWPLVRERENFMSKSYVTFF